MKLSDILESVKSVGITGHVRPDGDCIGSCLALYNYVSDNYPHVEVKVFLQKPGDEFGFINGIEKVQTEPTDEAFDAFFVMDCSSGDRFEPFAKVFENASKKFCVDHHLNNGIAVDDSVVLPDASSTCEVLYGLMDDDKVSRATAECIYTGIVHDTGVFKYSCTSSKTMAIAGKMMDKGIAYTEIIDNSFYKKSYVQNQILGRALLESILFYDGRCIFSAVSRKEMEFYGIDGKGLGGIIEQLRLTEGVEVAIFMYETGVSEYKVSLRSKSYVDVCQVASYFGGGGHARAAGCTMQGTVHDIVNNIGARLELQMGK